jgi:hypothetical protein
MMTFWVRTRMMTMVIKKPLYKCNEALVEWQGVWFHCQAQLHIVVEKCWAEQCICPWAPPLSVECTAIAFALISLDRSLRSEKLGSPWILIRS